MVWAGFALYVVGVPVTYWLTGHVEVFRMVCVEDRPAMAVVWPLTWLAAFCTALLIATAAVHARIARRSGDAH